MFCLVTVITACDAMVLVLTFVNHLFLSIGLFNLSFLNSVIYVTVIICDPCGGDHL